MAVRHKAVTHPAINITMAVVNRSMEATHQAIKVTVKAISNQATVDHQGPPKATRRVTMELMTKHTSNILLSSIKVMINSSNSTGKVHHHQRTGSIRSNMVVVSIPQRKAMTSMANSRHQDKATHQFQGKVTHL